MNVLEAFALFATVTSLSTNNEKAAQENYDLANQLLSECKNKESNEALTRAAMLGHAKAQMRLGDIYLRCNKLVQAKYWLTLAAKAGLTDALYNLGAIYRNEENYQQAALCFDKLAETGDCRALYEMADLHARGRGVPQDMRKAIELLKKAYPNKKDFDIIGINIEETVRYWELEITTRDTNLQQLEDAANVLVCIGSKDVNQQKKGRWSDKEKILFENAVKRFILPYPNRKIQWSVISKYIQSRDPIQCRTHYQKWQKKTKNSLGKYKASMRKPVQVKPKEETDQIIKVTMPGSTQFGKLRSHMKPASKQNIDNDRIFQKVVIGKRICCFWRKKGQKWFPLEIISLREDMDNDGWWIRGKMDDGKETNEFLIKREGFGHYWREEN